MATAVNLKEMVRPQVAKESWRLTALYCMACMAFRMYSDKDVFDIMVASVLISPCGAYIGFRTGDKVAEFKYKWQNRNGENNGQQIS